MVIVSPGWGLTGGIFAISARASNPSNGQSKKQSTQPWPYCLRPIYLTKDEEGGDSEREVRAEFHTQLVKINTEHKEKQQAKAQRSSQTQLVLHATDCGAGAALLLELYTSPSPRGTA